MNKIREMKCRKCGEQEKVYLDVESHDGPGTYKRQNTFFCKDCDHLSTVNTVSEALKCKHCRSSNLTKFFSESKVKCNKCGVQGFDIIKDVNA
ncbi:MAG TPA: hypothetical protein VKE88_03480 [Candidatus Nanoarchaeia archaeon]|nr:hypothetical protein [Candidatus Nanoarchaeia archaeon]